ncbi:hypothetical protein Bca101_001118 [Brassica carinata]
MRDESTRAKRPGEALTSPVSLSQTNSTEDLEVYDDEEDGDFSDLGIVSGKISTKKVSPAPSPSPSPDSYAPQSETRMSPSPSPSDSPTTMPPGYIHQPPSLSPEESDLKYKDGSGTERESSSGGGKKAGIAVGVIAAASMVGLGGYVLKKRRENIRRSRYEYAATEIF